MKMTLWANNTAGETLYYTHGGQKNVTALFGQTVERRAQYEYDPYGNPINTTGDAAALNPYRYSSEYHDEDLGLIYYNYRHYNPQDGRWISRDPIAEQGGVNLYAFVRNNVLFFIDRLGLADTASIAIAQNPAAGAALFGEAGAQAITILSAAEVAKAEARQKADERRCKKIHDAYDTLSKMLGSTSCQKLNPVSGNICAVCVALRHSIDVLREIVELREKFIDLACDYVLKWSIERGSERAERGHKGEVKTLDNNRDQCIKKFHGLNCNKCKQFKENPLRDSYSLE